MSLKDQIVVALASATNKGLHRAGAVFLCVYTIAMMGAAYFSVEPDLDQQKRELNLRIRQIDEAHVRNFANDMKVERNMIGEHQGTPVVESVVANGVRDAVKVSEKSAPSTDGTSSQNEHAQSLTEWPPEWLQKCVHGYPILYTFPMARLEQAAGRRALLIFNVVCTLLSMWLIQRIGVRFWLIRRSAENFADQSAPDTEKLVEAAQQDVLASAKKAGDESSSAAVTKSVPPTNEPPAAHETPVTATLFGIVAMCIYGLNPIVVGQAVSPGPRPFAYLLTTGAIGLALRVLENRRMPWGRTLLLVTTAVFVHAPAILALIPIVLLGAFGKLAGTLEKKTFLDRIGAHSRKLLLATIAGALLPIAGTFLTSWDGIDHELIDGLPDSVQQFALRAESWSTRALERMGEFISDCAPQLAILALFPLSGLKGVVERTMIGYALVLIVIFTFFYPEIHDAQYYPVMLPVAFLGAVAVVNMVHSYVENAVAELTSLSIRFFALLAALPVVGSVMVTISTVNGEVMGAIPREFHGYLDMNLGLNGAITPWTLIMAGISLVGFLRQYRSARLGHSAA